MAKDPTSSVKKLLIITLASCFISACFFISCKKEKSCEGCSNGNHPPVADAGNDTIVRLPVDSVLLNGSLSTDPDGTITTYNWTKIKGPSSSTILKPNLQKAMVKALSTGTYQFELTVTDDGGLSARDTVQVIVNSTTQTNRPPVANAGSDQTISSPASTVTLDGSASFDPDNNITYYSWTKISGPPSFSFANSSAVQTEAIYLEPGTYQFELKVTDAEGLFSMDTVQVIITALVNNNCARSQTRIGSLSLPRQGVLIQSAGNKILFAGGEGPANTISSRVDIYDLSTQSWSTANLSVARNAMGAVTLGSKIYFAGGNNGSPSSRIDIYDASSDTWSTAELSEPREDVIAVAAGNKVVLAGGYNNGTKVDIYNQLTGTWSTATLSKPMAETAFHGYYSFFQSGYISVADKIYFTGNNISIGSNSVDVYDASNNTWSTQFISPNQFAADMAVSSGNKIYFSGSPQGSAAPDYNYAKTLEVYDVTSNGWSSVNMSSSRAYMGAISGDDKIFWAGGFDSSWLLYGEQSYRQLNNIEIYDVKTGLHSFHNLPQSDWFVKALKTNNKIFFYYKASTEIYDISTHSWTSCTSLLFQPFAIDNIIYQVGADNSGVWKLEF